MSANQDDTNTAKGDWLHTLNHTADVLGRLEVQVREREGNNPEQPGYLDRIQRVIRSLRAIHNWLESQPPE